MTRRERIALVVPPALGLVGTGIGLTCGSPLVMLTSLLVSGALVVGQLLAEWVEDGRNG